MLLSEDLVNNIFPTKSSACPYTFRLQW